MNAQAFVILLLILIIGGVGGYFGLNKVAGSFAEKAPIEITIGSDTASVKVVQFFDYLDPASRRIYRQLLDIRANDPDVQFVLRDLPKPGQSEALARVGLALKTQNLYKGIYNKFMRVNMALLEQSADVILAELKLDTNAVMEGMELSEVSAALNWNRFLAKAMGIEHAPALVIDGTVINHDGYTSKELLDLIEKARKK